MEYDDVVKRLEALANPSAIEGMARFGITGAKVYGVSVPDLRALAKEIGRDHLLAQRLWGQGSREARILATIVADPQLLSETQAEAWALDFDSWEVCDQCCINLLERTPYAYEKAAEWSGRSEEMVKRAGFVLMARLAVSDKKAPDHRFEAFLPLIRKEAGDPRNMVRKAVNWALRAIGKRNPALNDRAIETARHILAAGGKGATWVASDALQELTSEAVQQRLRKKPGVLTPR